MVMPRDENGNGPKVDWESRVEEAFQSTLDEGEMVLRWLAIAEIVDSDGDRLLYTMSSPDLQNWEGWGLLKYAQTVQEVAMNTDAQINLGMFDDDEDD